MAVVIGDAAVAVRADPSRFGSDAEGPILSKIRDIGGKAAGVFAGALAIGGAFASALDQAALGDKLAAQLGLTEERSAEVGRVAGSLYADAYGDSLGTVNTAVGAVMTSIDGMASASSADLESMTARALDFATAFDQDVTAATSTAGNLIRTGLAENGAEAFDLLTRSFQQVPAAMREELPAILDEYGVNFSQLGFTGEQAFGMLTAAADGGAIVLDKTGDALKEFSIRATDMSATSVAAYDTLGLNAETMAARLLAGGDTAAQATQQIAQGLLGIQDPVERANTSIALFGTPLEDLGVNKIPAFLSSIAGVGPGLTDAAGASDRLGTTLNDNASANLTSFMRTAQQLAVDVLGGQVIPKVQEVVTWVKDNLGPAWDTVVTTWTEDVGPVLEDVTGWLKANEEAVRNVALTIGAVFLPALLRMGIQALISGAQVAAGWAMAAVGAATASVATVFNTGVMIGRWIAMGIAAAVSFGQTIAIMALYAASSVASAASAAGAWFMAQLRTVASLAATAAGFVVQGAVMAASMAATAARVVAGWVLMGVQSMIQAARMAAAWFIALGPVGWVIAAVIGLVALIIANWTKVKTFTVNAFNAVVDAVKGAFRSVVSGVSSGISTVISFFSGLPGKILGALGNLGGLLLGAGRSLIQGLVNGISGAASFVGDVAGSIWRAVRGFINSNVIGRLNSLLEFTIMGVTVNPPDIPMLHSGGVFTASGGEGLALLRDEERVITPEQRRVADNLLASLLAGNLRAGAAAATAVGGTQVQVDVHASPGMSVGELSAHVATDLGWALSTGATAPAPAFAGGPA